MRIKGLGFSRDKQIANLPRLVHGFMLKIRQASVQNVVEDSHVLLVKSVVFSQLSRKP